MNSWSPAEVTRPAQQNGSHKIGPQVFQSWRMRPTGPIKLLRLWFIPRCLEVQSQIKILLICNEKTHSDLAQWKRVDWSRSTKLLYVGPG